MIFSNWIFHVKILMLLFYIAHSSVDEFILMYVCEPDFSTIGIRLVEVGLSITSLICVSRVKSLFCS